MSEQWNVANSPTQGRAGECFIIMPFGEIFQKAFHTIDLAARTAGFAPLRGDQDLRAGTVFEHIVERIRAAAVVVADLTGNNPNVNAEVGIAIALGKPTILISRGDLSDLPFDLRHFRVFPYEDSDNGYSSLGHILQSSLAATRGPNTSPAHLIKELLAPRTLGSDASTFVIAASPLAYREAVKMGGGFASLRGTTADHVGIRGLIHAFGLIFGFNSLPELVNPGDYRDEAMRNAHTPMDLCCIGSAKANRWTGLVLNEFYEKWSPRLEFKADPSSDDLRNIRVNIHQDGVLYPPPKPEGVSRLTWDFGLIIRGPHPCYPKRMMLVLAGRSALGTHAACLAATTPLHLQYLKERLREDHGKDLDNHEHAFWAVAHVSSDGSPLYRPRADTLRMSAVHAFESHTQNT